MAKKSEIKMYAEVLKELDPLQKLSISNDREFQAKMLEKLCQKVHNNAMDQFMDYIENMVATEEEVDLNVVRDACKCSNYIKF